MTDHPDRQKTDKKMINGSAENARLARILERSPRKTEQRFYNPLTFARPAQASLMREVRRGKRPQGNPGGFTENWLERLVISGEFPAWP